MKGKILKRFVALAIVFCMLLNMLPSSMGDFVIEAKAVSGISSLTCAGFISDTTRQNYIDVMMQHYLNTNSKLTTTLDNGYCVVFMFEGGSDNYTNTPYVDAVGSTRTQAVVIVVKKDSSGNAYIDYYNESCSSIPDDANWTSGGSCDNCTTVLDGIYSMQTWNHTGPYAALNLYDATWSWYTPTQGSTGWGNYCSGINVHTRRSNYTGGRSAGYAQSAGCQLISYGENSSNGFNDFMKSVTGITWNPWNYPYFNTFASTGSFKGYYVLDRQLGLVNPSGTEYGSGSLATLYTKGDLDAITQFSTNARANASFSYLDKCPSYPAYCNIEVTLEGAPINTLPCSSGTDKSTTIESAVKGDKYVATAIYKNLYGNYWYKIQTKSGETGYIYGGEVKYLSQITPDVKLQNATPPNGHPTGTAFYLNGTVKSTYNDITKVEAAVYRGFGTTGEKPIGGSETITTKSYKIEGSKVDNDTWFNKIEPGKYTYVIYASYKNCYTEGATTLKTNTGTLTLMSEYFVTVATATNQSTCSHSYENTVIKAATCTAGGNSVKSCSKCGLLSKVTDTKLGHSKGTAIKENVIEGVSYDSVIYCTRCKAEVSREAVNLGQNTNPDNGNTGGGNTGGDTGGNTGGGSAGGDNTRINIKRSFLTSAIKNYTYTGKAIKQSGITLKDGSYTLKNNTDYTVKYINNTNAGTATVIITGIGKYCGCIMINYTIAKAKVTTANVTLSNSRLSYTGSALKPSVAVKVAGKTLKSRTDYTISYSNNKKIGKASVTVKGNGNYTGTVTMAFDIVPKKVSNFKQTGYAVNNVPLKWAKVKGADGYEILRKDMTTGKLKKVGTTKNTTYKVTGLKSGSTYKYGVRAYTVVNGKKVYGDVSVVRTTITRTMAPKIKVTPGKKKVSVSWNEIRGTDGYEVFISTRKYINYTTMSALKNNVTRCSKSGLTSGKKYYIRVKSYKINAGGKKIYSASSSIMAVTIK